MQTIRLGKRDLTIIITDEGVVKLEIAASPTISVDVEIDIEMAQVLAIEEESE